MLSTEITHSILRRSWVFVENVLPDCCFKMIVIDSNQFAVQCNIIFIWSLPREYSDRGITWFHFFFRHWLVEFIHLIFIMFHVNFKNKSVTFIICFLFLHKTFHFTKCNIKYFATMPVFLDCLSRNEMSPRLICCSHKCGYFSLVANLTAKITSSVYTDFNCLSDFSLVSSKI